MIPCPAGTYNDQESRSTLSDCLPCPLGQYCDEPAMTAAPTAGTKKCAAGYYCEKGSAYKHPYTDVPANYGPCPAGYYCLEGTSITGNPADPDDPAFPTI